MDITKNLGPAFKALRKNAQLTQEELSDAAGVDRTYISGLERGVRNPSVDTLQRLVEVLGVTLDALFIEAKRLTVEAPSKQSSKKSK